MFGKAKDTQKIQDVARISEKLELLKGPILLEKHSVDLDSYISKLEEKTEEYQVNYIDKIDENNAYTVLEGKYKFLIEDKDDGNVYITYEGIVGELELSEYSGTYTYPEEKTFTVTKNESGGELSVSSSNTNIATASINGNVVTVKSNTTAGTAIITVKCAETEEYKENRVTYIATVGNGTIEYTATQYSGTYDESGHGIKVTLINPSDAKITYYDNNGNDCGSNNPIYTDVGTYTTSFEIKKAGYKTVNDSRTINITQKTPDENDLVLSATSGNLYYEKGTTTFTVNQNKSQGTLSVSSSNSLVTAKITGNEVTLTATKNEPGTATITVTSAAKGNYKQGTATYKVTVIGQIIYTATNTNVTYNGSGKAITVTVTTPSSGATITYYKNGTTNNGTTNPTYTNAGTYTTGFDIEATGYKTVNDSRTVTIGQANGSLTLSATSGDLYYSSGTKTFTVTNNVSGGTLSVSSNNTSLVTASVSGSTITLKAVKNEPGTATITVTSAAKENYKAATATYKVTVIGQIKYTATAYSGEYNGSTHGITVSVTEPSGTTITYFNNNGTNCGSNNPTYTNVGTYTTSFEITKTGYQKVSDSRTVKINNASKSVLKVGDYVKFNYDPDDEDVGYQYTGTSSDQTMEFDKYNGLWRVLYNDSTNGLQIISNGTVGSITINGAVGYNGLIMALNSACYGYVWDTSSSGPVISARSVGSTTSSNQTTTGTLNIYSNSSYPFIANYANNMKIADTNYTSDVNVLEAQNMLNIGVDYWLASRYIYIDSNGAGFCGALVGTFNNYTGVGSILLKCVHSDGSGTDHSYTAGVRPVLKLRDTVKIKSGLGTSSSPWEIAI